MLANDVVTDWKWERFKDHLCGTKFQGPKFQPMHRRIACGDNSAVPNRTTSLAGNRLLRV